MIEHYHNLKVRYASLKVGSPSGSIDLIAPIIVLLIAGAALLYFLNPTGLGGFSIDGWPVGLPLLLGSCAAVFSVLAYASEYFPKAAFIALAVAGVALAFASVPFTLWLHDELAFSAMQHQVVPPAAWPIGGVFFVYGAIIAAYAGFAFAQSS